MFRSEVEKVGFFRKKRTGLKPSGKSEFDFNISLRGVVCSGYDIDVSYFLETKGVEDLGDEVHRIGLGVFAGLNRDY